MKSLTLVALCGLIGWTGASLFPAPFGFLGALVVAIGLALTWGDVWNFFTGVRYVDLSHLSRQYLPQDWVLLETTTYRHALTNEIVEVEAVIASLRTRRTISATGDTVEQAAEKAGDMARLLGDQA